MKSTNSRLMGVAAATILALLGGYLLYQNSGDSESEAAEQPRQRRLSSQPSAIATQWR